MKKKLFAVGMAILIALGTLPMSTVLALSTSDYAYSSGENEARILISSADHSMGAVVTDTGDGNFDAPDDVWSFTANAAEGFRFDHWETSGSEYVNQSLDDNVLSISFKAVLEPDEIYSAKAVFAPIEDIESDPSLQNSQFSEPVGSAQTSPLSNPSKDSEKLTDENPAGNDGAGLMCIGHNDKYKLNVYCMGYPAGGWVTVSPPSSNGRYPAGTVVTLSATPNRHSVFRGFYTKSHSRGSYFTGRLSSPEITMDGNKTIYALFGSKNYRFDHIDVWMAGKLTIEHRINGEFISKETINVRTSEVSATYVVDGQSYEVPNNKFIGCRNEWRALGLSFPWPDSITIRATLTNVNGPSETYDFEHTFGQAGLEEAYARCPGSEWWGTKGFDFVLTENVIENSITHTVTFAAGSGGTLEGANAGGEVVMSGLLDNSDFPTAPTPIPDENHVFDKWSPSLPSTVTQDGTYIALFKPNTYTVTFVDYDGSVIDTQTVEHGAAATAPAEPEREGYTFAGWDVAFDNVTSDLTVTAEYAINTYTVTFVDYDGTVLDEQTVEHGTAATAPAEPEREGYTFTGWDVAFDNVTSDLTVTAQYAINTYTVTFVDYDGTELSTQTVEHGTAATAPEEPEREGYTFTGWDIAFDSVTTDLTVTAQYAINIYTVTFVDYDGGVIDTQTVEHGTAATAPEEPEREGYTFTGWDVAFDNVTSDLTVTAQYAINTYTVTFVDYDGSVIDTQTVEHGSAATVPADPEREGYTFTGWDIPFDDVISDLTVTAQYAINTYTVTFVDYDGTVLDEQTVEHGTAATVPEDPERESYTFTGWDADFDSVTSDLTVTAQYQINTYTVTFVDYDGTELSTQTVEHGTAANAPEDPRREGYTFTGWDVAFDNVTSDLTVTAQYAINTYTVTFVDYDGTELSTQTVEHGTAATAPEEPEREGYTFTGWDADFDSVTSDLTVTAQYAINTYTVTFVDYDGTVLDEQTVEHGAAATVPEEPEREGYTFTGWDIAFDSVTSDLTVTAQYAINTYTVTFVDYDGTVLDEQTVEHGSAATVPEEPEREGYTFTGWDVAFDSVTTDLTVTAQYAINTYTVTFVDYDGDVIDEQTVEHGSAATAPADPEREGYTFTGWDADFDSVTSDLTVTAQYAINTYTVTFVDYDGTELSTQTVEHGSAATAPADPQRDGYTFTGWDIAFDSVTTDLTVTAQYELVIPTYTLNMTVVGQGSVAAMSATYPQGTVVNLLDIEATPAEGWQFTEWQDANGHSITSVTMDSDKEVFVVFSERTGTDDERTGTDDELTGTDNERTGTDNELMESANELTELNEELVEIGEEDVPEVPATADSTNAPSWYWWLLAVPAGLLLWWLLWLWFSVVPVAEQVVGNGDGTYTIQWGYKNRKLRRYKTDPQKSKLSLLLGKLLNVEPNPPVEFQKGEHSNVFTSTVSEDSILMWEINGSKKKVDISKYKK